MDDMPKGTAMEPQNDNRLAGLDPAELLKQGAGEDTFTENHPGGFTPPTLEELSEIFPRFEILELIGRGGMGAVYKVLQPELDRIVAMKILPPAIGLSPAFASRFTREAKALAKLNHPGIVIIHESGQEGGLYYILMEFVDGVNLRQLLANGRISPREAMAIVPQICDALQFAHDQGIVHRDIKPENLLLDRLGRVKVADFGIAKLIGNDDPSATATHAMEATLTDGGKAMGTPQYMAPEQTDSPTEVDHRADIFALGVVFYQMLTGELPEKDLKAPSSKVRIDVRLDEVVLRALEKNPKLRYPSATEMRTGIEMVGDEVEVGAEEKTFASNWSKGYRSERTLFGLPLVHVAGFEPIDGKQETARGILAIGGKAQGVLAFGGVASGMFAFGGVAIGLFSFGGVAVGAISLGGLAIALFLALGGLAFGSAAMGGSAFGYLGYGAKTYAAHALSPQHSDPVARDFFFPWAPDLLANLGVILFFLMALVFLVSFGVPLWIVQRRALMRKSSPRKQPVLPHRPVKQGKSTNFKILAILGILLLFVIAVPLILVLLFFFVSSTSVKSSTGTSRAANLLPDMMAVVSSEPGTFEVARFFPEDEIPIIDLLGRRVTPLGDRLLEEAELPDFSIAYHTTTDTDGTTGQKMETRHFLTSRAESFSISAAPTGLLRTIPDQTMEWEVVQKDPYGTASVSMTGNLGRWYAFRIVSTKGRTAYGSFRLSPSESPVFRWTYLGARVGKNSAMGILKIELASSDPVKMASVLRDEIVIAEALVDQAADPTTAYIDLSLEALRTATSLPHHDPARITAEKSLSDFKLLHPGFPNEESLEAIERQFNVLRREYAEKYRISSDGNSARIDTEQLTKRNDLLRAHQRLVTEWRDILSLSGEVVPAASLPESNRLVIRSVNPGDKTTEKLTMDTKDKQGEERREEIAVGRNAIIWDRHISEALVSGEDERHQIHITLDQIGERRMAKATQPGERQLRLAIMIDGKIKSAPVVVSTPLGKSFVIDGLKEEEASDLLKGLPTWENQTKSNEAALWLSEIDEGNFAESYDMAGDLFQKGVTKEKWEQLMENLRTPLGLGNTMRKPVRIQDLTSLPGLPDGEYRVVQFQTVFLNKASSLETLYLHKEADGVWKVAGYFIN